MCKFLIDACDHGMCYCKDDDHEQYFCDCDDGYTGPSCTKPGDTFKTMLYVILTLNQVCVLTLCYM